MKRSTFLITGFIVSMIIHANGNQGEKTPAAENRAFKDGEKLTYLLHYGIIRGGNAELTINAANIGDKEVYHARALAKSVGVTDMLFSIEDIYESFFEPESCLPQKAIRNIKEGKYRYYNEVEYDHAQKTVSSQKSGNHEVPEFTLDMVSALYYLRSLDFDKLEKGQVIEVSTYFADEIFPFSIRYKGKEKVKTNFGKIWCHRFDPVVEPGRIFKSEDDMSFWLTDDENKIPVLVQFDLIVGSVKCELIEYKNTVKDVQWHK